MDEDAKDELFARPCESPTPFRFDEAVARVFPDMVSRSVPCYRQLVELTGLVGARFLRPDTRAYDLGCSLGAVTFALLSRTPSERCEIVAVDKSPAMLRALRQRLCETPQRHGVLPVCADVRAVRIENASLVVLNLTLQFIPPGERLELLRRVRAGLAPGGALVLTEKVCSPEPAEQDLLTSLHDEFKRANGYSELEISQKRAALERVLVPETAEQHLQRLNAAGFRHTLRWFQCLNFVSMLSWT